MAEAVNIWLDIIEQRIADYHVNVDDLAREVEETREETGMDTLLADERDEIDSDDSDWSWITSISKSAEPSAHDSQKETTATRKKFQEKINFRNTYKKNY